MTLISFKFLTHTLSLISVFTFCCSLTGLSFSPIGKVKRWHLTQVQNSSIPGLLIYHMPILPKFWNCPETSQGSSLSCIQFVPSRIFLNYFASSACYFFVVVDTVGNFLLCTNSFLAFSEPVLFWFSPFLADHFLGLFGRLFWLVFTVFSHSAGYSIHTQSSVP